MESKSDMSISLDNRFYHALVKKGYTGDDLINYNKVLAPYEVKLLQTVFDEDQVEYLTNANGDVIAPAIYAKYVVTLIKKSLVSELLFNCNDANTLDNIINTLLFTKSRPFGISNHQISTLDAYSLSVLDSLDAVYDSTLHYLKSSMDNDQSQCQPDVSQDNELHFDGSDNHNAKSTVNGSQVDTQGSDDHLDSDDDGYVSNTKDNWNDDDVDDDGESDDLDLGYDPDEIEYDSEGDDIVVRNDEYPFGSAVSSNVDSLSSSASSSASNYTNPFHAESATPDPFHEHPSESLLDKWPDDLTFNVNDADHNTVYTYTSHDNDANLKRLIEAVGIKGASGNTKVQSFDHPDVNQYDFAFWAVINGIPLDPLNHQVLGKYLKLYRVLKTKHIFNAEHDASKTLKLIDDQA